MKNSNRSQLTSSDVQGIAGVSRTKAVDIIRALGGGKDVAGRWAVDARTFYVWYNSPTRNFEVAGGDYHMTIERILNAARELAGDGGAVSFTLTRKADRPHWMIRMYGPGKQEKTISLGTPDKRTAQEIESQVRARFSQLAVSGIVPYNAQQFFTEWLELKEREVSTGTYKRYRAVVDKSLPFMPPELYSITHQHIERYKDWLLREQYKPRSIILELNTLSTIFRKAVRLGYMRDNPAQGIDKPRKPQTEVVPYTDKELNAIFEELHSRAGTGRTNHCTEAWAVYREIFYGLLYTGMRVSDLLNLKWENVSLQFASIRLRQQKTGREAHIRIPTPYLERLRILAGEAPEPTGYVYCNTAGKSVTYTRIDNAIRQVTSACCIDKRSPIHSFRHTAAMKMLGAGVPVYEVAAQLGDTVETIVRNYIKPAAPSSETIDVAYCQQLSVSRKCPEHLSEMAHFGGFGTVHQNPSNQQKSPKNKGFSEISEKPQSTVQM